jgi:dTDP-4-amino-4,6-dideoxygalactose transaminase
LGLSMGNRKDELSVTEEMSGRLLRLPMYAGMEENEISIIISTLARSILKIESK